MTRTPTPKSDRRRRYDAHWSHLALSAALEATLRGNTMSKVACNLLRRNAEKLAAALDPNYTAEHAAADLVSGEVAEAMCKAFEVYGNRAIHPSAFGAAQHPRMSAEQVYVLLRLCRAIRTEERLAAMSAPSALTIVVGGDTEELSFKWAISGALLPDWMCTDRYVNEPFQIITAEMCEVNQKKQGKSGHRFRGRSCRLHHPDQPHQSGDLQIRCKPQAAAIGHHQLDLQIRGGRAGRRRRLARLHRLGRGDRQNSASAVGNSRPFFLTHVAKRRSAGASNRGVARPA